MKWFGATGDGVTDDRAAIQAAIDACQADGAGAVHLPAGSFKTTAPLVITAGLALRGVGYQGDGGRVYQGLVLPDSTGFIASVIVPGPSHNAINIEANDAVRLEAFQIVYPQVPGPPPADAGTTAILLTAAQGAANANTYSVIRDVCITGARVGITVNNAYDFVIDNCNLLNCWDASMYLSNTNYPSFSDSTICNSTLFSGTVQQHIAIFSGGGYRFENNKINGSKPGGYGIVVAPNLTGTPPGVPNVEPLMIVGNSIEGQAVGILFQRSSGNGVTSAIVINGNEIFCGKNCIVSTVGQAQDTWITGMAITGNLCIVNENDSVAVSLGGAQLVSITGNVFTLSSAATTPGIAVFVGPGSSDILQSGNVKSGNLT